MPKNKKQLSVTQIQRLMYIEHLACFDGMVNREDIKNKFGISAASATNDFSTYNGMAPDNLVYNIHRKCYEISNCFTPIYDISALTDRIPLYTMPKLHKPADKETIEKIAAISRAIQKIQALKITYSSAASGTTSRQIIPVAFGDNLLRWHLRAYDRKRKKHIDFVINRIKKVEILEGNTIEPHESRDKDQEWLSFIELKIKAHPYNLADKRHFDMGEEVRIVETRAAMAGYFLEIWNVDCSPNAELRGKQYQYVLSNLEEVSKVANLELAPGYKNKQ